MTHKPKLMRFYFSTKVVLNGCDVSVIAENVEEARKKIYAGEWENVNLSTGEMVDWNPDTKPTSSKPTP